MRYTLNAIGLGKHDEALKTVEFVRELKSRESRFLAHPSPVRTYLP